MIPTTLHRPSLPSRSRWTPSSTRRTGQRFRLSVRPSRGQGRCSEPFVHSFLHPLCRPLSTLRSASGSGLNDENVHVVLKQKASLILNHVYRTQTSSLLPSPCSLLLHPLPRLLRPPSCFLCSVLSLTFASTSEAPERTSRGLLEASAMVKLRLSRRAFSRHGRRPYWLEVRLGSMYL